MHKIRALYINELIKIVCKPLYIVMAVVTVVTMIFAALIYSDSLSLNSYYEEYRFEASESELVYYQNEISWSKLQMDQTENSIAELVTLLESAEDEEAVYEYYSQIVSGLYDYYNYLSTYCRYTLLTEYKLPDWRAPQYINECVELVISHNVYSMFNEYAEDMLAKGGKLAETELENGAIGNIAFAYDGAAETDIDEYRHILSEKDYAAYISADNAAIEKDSTLSEQMRELKLQANEMKLSLMSEGYAENEETEDAVNAISKYVSYKEILFKGSESNRVLTENEYDEYVAMADELELAIEKKAVGYGAALTGEKDNLLNTVLEIGVIISSLTVLFYAASSISDEFQTGSIKALIIAPVKRSKIFIAKVLAVVTLCLVSAATVFTMVMLVNTVTGFETAPMVYTGLNGASQLDYCLYTLCSILFEFLKTFIYALFALMLSALIRNSAASTCIALCEYLLITNVVPMFYSIECTDNIFGIGMEKFFPAYNLSLTDKVFKVYNANYVTSILNLFELEPTAEISLAFSACYIAVLGGCLFYIAYDSFCRRDIK